MRQHTTTNEETTTPTMAAVPKLLAGPGGSVFGRDSLSVKNDCAGIQRTEGQNSHFCMYNVSLLA